jgi:uncharacterized protein (DUF2062 family)
LRSTFRSASRFAAGVIWLFLPRQDKVGLPVQAIMALVLAVVLVSLAVAASILVGSLVWLLTCTTARTSSRQC